MSRIFCTRYILKYVIPTVKMLNSIKDASRIDRKRIKFLPLFFFMELFAIRLMIFRLLFASIQITCLYDLPILDVYDPVRHLGDVIVMRDQYDRLLELLCRYF